jgi:hypothetical protein
MQPKGAVACLRPSVLGILMSNNGPQRERYLWCNSPTLPNSVRGLTASLNTAFHQFLRAAFTPVFDRAKENTGKSHHRFADDVEGRPASGRGRLVRCNDGKVWFPKTEVAQMSFVPETAA